MKLPTVQQLVLSASEFFILGKTPRPWVRYGVAIVASVGALVLTLVLWPMIQPSIFPLFFAAVMLSSWYGGLGPGLVATAMAVTSIDYFFLPEPGTRIVAFEMSLRLGIFALVALLISSLTAARQRAEAALRKAHDELEIRVQERTAELAGANEALRAEIVERKRAEQERQELLHDLQKRVNELTVLHKMARLLQEEQKSTKTLMQKIVSLLPTAWQHPEVAAARMGFNGAECATTNFAPVAWRQRAEFIAAERARGFIEVVYLEEKTPEVEGPFLAEERSLLNSLAEMLQAYFERQLAEQQVAQVTRELIERNAELWRLQREMGRVEPLAALGRVTGTIAHELGTPLNSVLGYTQLLAQENLSETARESLQIIESQVQRMVEIIQYYLSRTRGSLQRHQRVNINTLLHETLLLLKPIFQQHQVQITTTLSDTLPLLTGNEASLQRVFINLFNNAVDAMEGGGVITLVTRMGSFPSSVRSGVVIEIADSGEGIPTDVLPHIFDLFMTTKTSGKGTGLGLAVCQEIIKGHDGVIDITSVVGEGTCVRVFLPTEEHRTLPLMESRQ